MTIIHKRNACGDPNEIYIGRPSKWGNPFVIGKDGDRTEVIEKYRQWLWARLQEPEFFKDFWFTFQHDVTLICYCAPKPCHGDVIERAANWIAGLYADNQQPADFSLCIRYMGTGTIAWTKASKSDRWCYNCNGTGKF